MFVILDMSIYTPYLNLNSKVCMQNNTEEHILRYNSVFLPLSNGLLSFNFSDICVPSLLCLLTVEFYVVIKL